jgi:hypothetical protein
VHDVYDRLGMVYEVRGDNRQAADCYHKVIPFTRDHPDDYELGFEEVFAKLVDRLDPLTATLLWSCSTKAQTKQSTIRRPQTALK